MSPINFEIDIKSLKGVTQDSRKVKDGYLFAAFQGNFVDGREYISDAITRGASVILSDKEVTIDDSVNYIISENPRKAFSHIVSEFYPNQPDHIIEVTGTNGKSSVVHFINQLWQSIDVNGAFIGTLSGSMTTPDPVSLHRELADLYDDKITHVALEASSEGLDQYRIDGLHVDVAVFTSFSQDHLDYHLNMNDYLSSKSRLFSEVLGYDGIAVLNADIPEYKYLLDICKKRGVRVLSYGKNGSDVKLLSVSALETSQSIKIDVLGKTYSIGIPLVGYFQVMNALCALACVITQFPERIEEIVKTLSNLNSVTGRMQHVRDNIYVDYAHTPDALENALKALRYHTKGNLICLFGCGGDRDTAKRPLMGEIVSRLADVVIVTDDNPRSENPAEIRKEILSDMDIVTVFKNKTLSSRGKSRDLKISPLPAVGRDDKGYNIHEIGDRREAIKFAVNIMGDKDIVLVAGKGHEQGQVFDNGRVEPFDDVYEVNAAIASLKSNY